MKKIGAIIFLSVLATFALAKTETNQKTIYYYGHIETTHLPSNHVFPLQDITLKKVMDSKNSRIVEIACAPTSPSSSTQYTVSPIYMEVKGNALRITDTSNYIPNNISGTGSVLGKTWSWENLTFDMKTQFGGNTSWVKDVNFVSGPFLYGTKYIFINEGSAETPKRKDEAELLMNLKMREVSFEEFRDYNSSLGCNNSLFKIIN